MPKSIPPVQESFYTNFSYDRVNYIVTYWDTCTLARTEELDLSKLRPLEYRDTDVFIICFDITNPTSFQNVSTVWVPELKHYMPETPVLVVGNKKDMRTNTSFLPCMVSPSKGEELAARLGTVYRESSGYTGEGIREVVGTAVRLAVQHRLQTQTNKKRFRMFRRSPSKLCNHHPEPPLLPVPVPAPEIKVEDSKFAEDMKCMLDRSTCYDVSFRFGSNLPLLQAHRFVLSIGSEWFRDFFENQDHLHKNQTHRTIDIHSSTHETQEISESLRLHTSPIYAQPRSFTHLIRFLYLGQFDVFDKGLVSEVLSTLNCVHIAELKEICTNILNNEDFMNKDVIESFIEKKSKIAKEVFLNRPLMSDVVFRVEGLQVHAHKGLIMARSEVMAAMFGGSFAESSNEEIKLKDTPLKAFIGLLEYLYTDKLSPHESLDEDKQLLTLADRFCLNRMRSLCERRISEHLIARVKKQMSVDTETCEEVIDAYLLSQALNADQLHRSCAYIMKTNYADFEFKEVLSQLKPADIQHLTEHRWPPLSFFRQLEEYKKKTGRH
ncbi:predicted protein [Nematostella vectensis]|uniref:BTB domain-containing protein n=1 Tax=Nematostella vectensis TaxID=45351 RepID=A7S278_NEMVE|nr:predicted protein [Nematostella vectensis]|eukprot:XP_001634253.1 predicted protein [Nematostella vectensis]